MRTTLIFTALAIAATTACNKDSAPTTTPDEATQPASVADTVAEPAPATEPDPDKLVLHINNHLELPADRAKVLEACADTPEFTEGEKRWVASRLPEGTYESPEDVLTALGVHAE